MDLNLHLYPIAGVSVINFGLYYLIISAFDSNFYMFLPVGIKPSQSDNVNRMIQLIVIEIKGEDIYNKGPQMYNIPKCITFSNV